MNQEKKINWTFISISLGLGFLLILLLGFGTTLTVRFWRDWTHLQSQIQNGEGPNRPESMREGEEETSDSFQSPIDFDGAGALVTQFSCEDYAQTLSLFRTYLVHTPTSFRASEYASALAYSFDPLGYWSADESLLLHKEMFSKSRELKKEVDSFLRADSACFQSDTCSCPMHEGLARAAALEMRNLREAFEKGALLAQKEETESSEKPRDLGLRKEDLELPHDEPKKQSTGTNVQALKDAEALGKKIELFSQKWKELFEVEDQKREDVNAFIYLAEERYFPSYSEKEWAGILLSSSVKASVFLSDAHSEWEVQGEESEMMALDLSSKPNRPLWASAHPNAVGVQLEKGALFPLLEGDTLVRVCEEEELLRCKWLVGLSYEAANQVSEIALFQNEKEKPPPHELYVEVLRSGKREVLRVSIVEEDGEKIRDRFQMKSFAYADTSFVLVKVSEIYESFGEDLRDALKKRQSMGEEILVLDLRDNGGGSVDAALSALASFLPDTPVIPVKSNNDLGQETYEVLRTEALPLDKVFTNPILVFVNTNTASAAEMIAGVLQSYGRGIVIGRKTFGKGCMQEFFPVMKHKASLGTLKITSALYALSDGKSVQRKGVSPDVYFPFSSHEEEEETESSFPNTAPSFGFIDIREEPKKRVVKSSFETLKLTPKSALSCVGISDAEVCGALGAFAKSHVR